jgi:hypothetical protein
MHEIIAVPPDRWTGDQCVRRSQHWIDQRNMRSLSGRSNGLTEWATSSRMRLTPAALATKESIGDALGSRRCEISHTEAMYRWCSADMGDAWLRRVGACAEPACPHEIRGNLCASGPFPRVRTTGVLTSPRRARSGQMLSICSRHRQSCPIVPHSRMNGRMRIGSWSRRSFDREILLCEH